jgi:hypothetical protein
MCSNARPAIIVFVASFLVLASPPAKLGAG